MNIHNNARLTFRGREILVSRSWNKACALRTLHRLPGSACARHTSGSGVIGKRASPDFTTVHPDLVIALTRPPLLVTGRSFD